MQNNISSLLVFLTISAWGNSQIDSVRNQLNQKLMNHTVDTRWKIDTTNTSTFIYTIDTFSVCSGFNPIRGNKKLDTLFVSFNFENGWSQTKMDSIEQLNLKVLTPIVPKYIAYYDSIGWGKARIKKRQLLEQPKTSVLQDWFKSDYLSDTERASLSSLIRLPDTLIGTVAVFHSRNFPPMFIIKPQSLENELDILLSGLNKDVLPVSTILRNEGFYLTSPFKKEM